MIKLYGSAVSNYTNMVAVALHEKGIEYEDVATMLDGSAEYLAKSPMGKVPCVEIEGKFLSETAAILDYLEETHPSPALYPSDPLERAKVREMVRVIELYFELTLRRLYPTVFFGAPDNDAAIAEVKPIVEKGVQALSQLASFGPYLAGSEFTVADIYAYYTFAYGNMATQSTYDWDLMAAIPGLEGAFAAISDRAAVKPVDAAQQVALAAFKAEQQNAA